MAADDHRNVSVGAPGSIAEAILLSLGDEDRSVRKEAIWQASHESDPDELVHMVEDHADARRRNAAIEALASGGARSVPALVRTLRHPDPEVIMFAASILGRTRDLSAVEPLIALVETTRDDNVAAAAIEALGKLAALEAVEPLVRALDRGPWLQFAAVFALGEIGDAGAVPALANHVDDPMIGTLAINALGKIGGADAVAHLARALDNADAPESFAATLRALGDAIARQPDLADLEALGEWRALREEPNPAIETRLAELLDVDDAPTSDESDLELRTAAVSIVRALRMQSLYAPLVLAARSQDLCEPLRFSALFIGNDLADALAMGMTYDNANVQVLACYAAGALRLRGLADHAADLLDSPTRAVRKVALETLERLGHYNALPHMISLIADPDPLIRGTARTVLVRMDAGEVSSKMLAMHPTPHTLDVQALRDWLMIMRANPHPNQAPFVESCLSHEDPSIRAAAIEVLDQLPARGVVAAITPLLDDASPVVRIKAIRALARFRLGHVRDLLLDQLDRDPATAAESLRVLTKLGDAATTPSLIERFGKLERTAQAATIEALTTLRDPGAEAHLVRMLANPDVELRRAAVVSLCRIGSPSGLRHALSATRDEAWQVRAALAQALPDLNDDHELAALERLSVDRHEAVAAVAARRLRDRDPDQV